MLLTSSDTKRTLMRTGFNMYPVYTQLRLTFLALQRDREDRSPDLGLLQFKALKPRLKSFCCKYRV